jgi:galactonate dehydratase
MEIENAVYVVPDAPGLGIVVNEEALRASQPDPIECPHLMKPDGSVTNW